jgi:mannan endo-1,4-beta-mannosidase
VAQDGDGDGMAEEFLLDARFGAIPGLPLQDGVDLSNYDLEFTFQGGDGKQVQLWYKSGPNWFNVYSFPYPITSGWPIHYNPLADGRNVDEFNDFNHIYAIGIKVFGGVEGVQIVSARLISRSSSSIELESASEGSAVALITQPHAGVSSENKLPPIIEGEFVTRQGGTLRLGDRPFFFSGTNSYFLLPEMAYGNSAGVTETLDTMVALGMPVVRIWAFNDHDPAVDPAAIQIEPGIYREESLVALDQVVAEAKKRNVRLILTLINYWPDYGGVNRYVEWYQAQCECEATIVDFYTNEIIKGWYKDYVRMLLNRTNTITGIRYKNEAAILALELGNELRNPTGSSDDLLAWQEEMAAFIKKLTPHLVADGGEGFDDAPELYPNLSNSYSVRGDEGASYHRLVNLENIDMVSYHLYPSKWGLDDKDDVEIWIRVHEELAQQADKVAYLGEYGVIGTDAHRATTFERWLTMALINNQSAGALVWGLAYQSRPDYDEFTVYCREQIESCAVLRDHAFVLTIRANQTK